MPEAVIVSLVKRRADLAEELNTVQAKLNQLHADLASLDDVIKQFDPEYRLDRAGQAASRLLRRHCLAKLVGHHERRLILYVQVPAELKGGDALSRVNEDGDCCEVVPDRELPAGEDGAAGDAELAGASLALPQAAGLWVQMGLPTVPAMRLRPEQGEMFVPMALAGPDTGATSH